MQSIKKVRSLFTKLKGDEDKIIKILKSSLQTLDRKKKGAFIGRAKAVDYSSLFRNARFPKRISSQEKVIQSILKLYEGVGLWGHPQMQVNVIPPPTTISIVTAALTARYNENSITDMHGMSASQSEVLAIGMLADLIGFSKVNAGGIFTFGGTACNLYAARIGIEKCDPDAKQAGISRRIYFFCSDASHYSIKTAAIWTGVGLNNIRVVPTDDDNNMDVAQLEKALNQAVKQGARIGTIFATMGTTDAFGIDPLKKIAKLRDKIQRRVNYKINLHADAVIGWPFLTFKGDKSIKHLPLALQDEIMSIVSKIVELQCADSVGIDFHKTGWAPYVCSAFVVKNKKDLALLKRSKQDMPYLYHDDGYQPGVVTLESSRPNYAQKALANMLLLGKEGYEALVVHLLTAADYLRDKIEKTEEIAVLNRHNPAFVTDFRLYPKTKYGPQGDRLFEKEMHDLTSAKDVERINKYNRKIAQCMLEIANHKNSSLISYTDSYKITKKGRAITAIKSYPMSPFMSTKDMEQLLKDVYYAKKRVDK